MSSGRLEESIEGNSTSIDLFLVKTEGELPNKVIFFKTQSSRDSLNSTLEKKKKKKSEILDKIFSVKKIGD